MTESMGSAVRHMGERWRWALYVALAIAGALRTFGGARAQQKATDDPTFPKLIDSPQRHRSAFLRTALPIDSVILHSLATQGREFTGRCPNACRLRYCHFGSFASTLIHVVWTR